MKIKLKSLAKDRDHGTRKFQRRRASAWFEHSQNFSQTAFDALQVPQTEGDSHNVETAISERQSQRVPLHEESAPDLSGPDLFIPDDEHRMTEVTADDTRVFFELERQISRAATQIESESARTSE